MILVIVVPIFMLLMLAVPIFMGCGMKQQHARRNVIPMHRVTPSAQPSPMALPAVMTDPVPTWTPPGGAPATGANTDHMFNADGTFK